MRAFRSLVAFGLVSFVCGSALGQQRIITTFAGRDWLFPLRPQPALNEPLGVLQSVAADSAGNVFIPDPDNNIVLRIDGSGNARVIAGNGLYGYTGDNGPAVNASLASPTAVAIDPDGNVFIADADNNRIRRVDTNGVITTYAGTGDYVHSGDRGPARNASLQGPLYIATGPARSLLVVEYGDWIRSIDSGGIITTIAGNGKSASTGDGGPAVSASLNEAQAGVYDRTATFTSRSLAATASGKSIPRALFPPTPA